MINLYSIPKDILGRIQKMTGFTNWVLSKYGRNSQEYAIAFDHLKYLATKYREQFPN